ncbi:hypothetical protein ABT010_38625 [Streptomyces sp. NPDC002668]|uniref:hypothetical protein n=1 Tax=Streptomyces sp. NPDC002668 TaxID=3154422 RepID=UPI0033314870
MDRIEPPGRIDRIVTAAQTLAEKAFCARTVERLGEVGVARLLALVAEDNEDGAALLASLHRRRALRRVRGAGAAGVRARVGDDDGGQSR